MNIAPGLRSANGAAPPRRSAKGRVAVSAAHSAARIPGSTRATTLAGSHAALVRRKEAIASARRDECGVVWFPSASDAAEASEASEAVVWVASAAPSRRASRSSRRRSTHESPCRKRTCSAVVAASRAARASSANVVSTANNDPVRARSANPTLTAPPSSSPAPSVAQVASRPESDRVAPRNARIKPFIARHRATTDASSFGYTRSKASTFSPELVSSIATLRTERSVRVGSRTPRRVIVRVSGKAGVPPATANAHAARPGFECTDARLMRSRLQGARYLRSL
mmetsp:Transcript_3084/g.13356  ORF Transcript_3084/g.13356 Transcript_3084/m.13356 type:complete len:283 (-) Transcript_3084:143-991(-)